MRALSHVHDVYEERELFWNSWRQFANLCRRQRRRVGEKGCPHRSELSHVSHVHAVYAVQRLSLKEDGLRCRSLRAFVNVYDPARDRTE